MRIIIAIAALAIATGNAWTQSPEAVMDRADEAMYRKKAAAA